MGLTDFAEEYTVRNNPDPGNVYDGEIQADICRACSVIEAVLCLTSNNTWRVILRNISIIIDQYLKTE